MVKNLPYRIRRIAAAVRFAEQQKIRRFQPLLAIDDRPAERLPLVPGAEPIKVGCECDSVHIIVRIVPDTRMADPR
jgi:hypothetical protein